jgi:hypothetical protein
MPGVLEGGIQSEGWSLAGDRPFSDTKQAEVVAGYQSARTRCKRYRRPSNYHASTRALLALSEGSGREVAR